jgi:hypothetical protein
LLALPEVSPPIQQILGPSRTVVLRVAQSSTR